MLRHSTAWKKGVGLETLNASVLKRASQDFFKNLKFFAAGSLPVVQKISCFLLDTDAKTFAWTCIPLDALRCRGRLAQRMKVPNPCFNMLGCFGLEVISSPSFIRKTLLVFKKQAIIKFQNICKQSLRGHPKCKWDSLFAVLGLKTARSFQTCPVVLQPCKPTKVPG